MSISDNGDLIKCEMVSQLDGSVLAISADGDHIDYDADDGVKWYKSDDVDLYIESLKNELAEQKSINNDLMYEVDELYRRGVAE